MAKEKKEKKEKKVKATKVEDDSSKISKKSKKDKKTPSLHTPEAESELLAVATPAAAKEEAAEVAVIPAQDGLLVPFAFPLANDKTAKKILKVVKKGAKNKTLKRGVKEVVKALRKSPSAVSGAANGIIVLAADISPMDVISHIPVLCEDHGVPYIFVSSRAELGAAGATKRPTSVVMVTPGASKGKKDAEVVEGFREAYDEAVTVIEAEMAKAPGA